MHHWHKMFDDAAVASPLRLGALARVSNDVWVDVWQIGDGNVREAGFGQPCRLSRQPLQRAMCAYVHYHVSFEHVSYPTVIGVIVVRHREVGAVVDA